MADDQSVYNHRLGNYSVETIEQSDGAHRQVILGQNYSLEAIRGNVPGHTVISIHGHNEAQGTTEVSVYPTGDTVNLDQSAISATPAVVGVASTDANDTSAGTGARTVRISGLDSSGNVQTNDVSLNGQTAVNTADAFASVHGMTVLTAGSSHKNAGVLWVGTGTFTSGVPAVRLFAADIGDNNALTAYYVVPTGKTLYVRDFTANLSTSNKDLEFRIQGSTDGLMWVTKERYGMTTGTFTVPILSLPSFPAGSHIRVTGESTSPSTDVTVIMSCELIDN